MRNPAPLVFSAILAILAIVLIVRQPEAPVASAPTEISAAVEAKPWPHELSDIPADPAIRFGELSNGFRYLILPNAEPPDRVSLRLHIAAGSLMEDQDQQGLAHFLEHMVFNGTKNFTPAELVPRMQRLGIAFGAHANAYTSFDETVYMLDLPDLSDPTLDLGFTVMRDFGDGALLLPEEIDKERGVILAEMNSRDSVDYRLMKRQFSELIPDSLIARRFPIGEAEVIRTAPRERFVDFYEKYYTPKNMTFVVVGDVDPETVAARIEATFGDMTNPADPGDEPGLGSIANNEGIEPAVFTDNEVAATELGLLLLDEADPQIDSLERRADRIPLLVAHQIMQLRFAARGKEEGSPIAGGSAYQDQLFRALEYGSLAVTVADNRWQDAVPVLEQEFRRALEFGFTAAELAEAKARLLNQLEQAALSKDTRPSPELATQIARSVGEGDVLSSPETDYAVAGKILEALAPADVHRRFVDFWKDRGAHLVLTTQSASDDAEATLARLYDESRSQAVEPPVEAEIPEFAFQDFGEPGEVTGETTFDDLGITRLELANGITVNLKPTDFEKNRIHVQARVGHGRLTLAPEQAGLDRFATAVVEEGGIGPHSKEELRQIFAGRNVRFDMSVDDDHFAVAGPTTPDDLRAQLGVMLAQILHPGYRPEAVAQFRKSIPELYQRLRHTPEGPMEDMRGWLRGGDRRFGYPEDAEKLLALEIDDLRPWLDTHFSNGRIELNLVGDVDPSEAREAILETFGAIPPRTGPAELPAAAREVEQPAAPATKTFTYESKIPQGRAIVFWKAPGLRGNEETFRRLQILASILDDRLREKIREELGAAYSPQGAATGSPALNDYGFLVAFNVGTPDDVPTLLEASLEQAAELAAEGASEDELDRALKPALSSVQQNLRDNQYWLGVLSGSTERPELLDLARSLPEDMASIDLETVNRLAAEYLRQDGALQIIIRPENAE